MSLCKNRCVKLMSCIINDLWNLGSSGTFRICWALCWPPEGYLTGVLCPSFHAQALSDSPLHISHSHLCLRLRHSSNFLPRNQVQSHREGQLCSWHWSEGACSNLAPCVHAWAAATFQGGFLIPFYSQILCPLNILSNHRIIIKLQILLQCELGKD